MVLKKENAPSLIEIQKLNRELWTNTRASTSWANKLMSPRVWSNLTWPNHPHLVVPEVVEEDVAEVGAVLDVEEGVAEAEEVVAVMPITKLLDQDAIMAAEVLMVIIVVVNLTDHLEIVANLTDRLVIVAILTDHLEMEIVETPMEAHRDIDRRISI